MAKSKYAVIHSVTNNILFEATSFPACQTFARNFLTNPMNFGQRLFVHKGVDVLIGNYGERIFDVTSIKYSSGKVRMTLYSEFLKHQKKK